MIKRIYQNFLTKMTQFKLSEKKNVLFFMHRVQENLVIGVLKSCSLDDIAFFIRIELHFFIENLVFAKNRFKY